MQIKEKNQEKLKSRKGITLVSLVVTIVILIILAIVSFNGLLGENGLITSAQKAVEKQKISSVQEELEMAKGQAYIEGKGHIDADRYFEILEEEGIIIDKEEDVEKIEEGVYEVTTEEGYVFEVIIPEDGEIEIDYIGKGENIGPRIKEIRVVEKTTNKVRIEVDARNVEGAEYTYWIKKETEGEESWQEVKGNNNSCEFNNLETNIVYDIRVKVETKNGETTRETSVITGELPEGTITFTEGEWVGDGTAKVTINTTAEGYILQYQIDGIEEGKWQSIGSGAEITGLGHGQTVYGRLYDGVNGTKDEASVEIKDEIAPIVTVEKGEVTTKSITVSASSSDGQWGMPEAITYRYYIKPSNGSYTTASYTGTNTSYTFNNLSQTTSYDVKVTTQDKAGNTGEGEAKGITTETIGGAGEGLIEGNIVASNPTWSNNKASITLSTSTGLTIQYQVNGITEGSWKTGTSVTGLNHNDTVYARLTDGVNYGDYASVIIQDKIAPNVPTITLSGTAGNNGYYKSNVTVKITAGSDGQSGANKVRYKVTGAQTVLQTDTAAGTVSASITISTNGTSTITAYTIDKAGNISSEKTQVVYKDSTAPTATLTVGAKTENSIAVSVSASDGQSGLATSGTYKYYINNALKSTSTSNNYTFTGLTAGTSYTLKVIVADKAGNTIEKSATASTNVSYPLASSILKEGDYVIYPEGNKFCMVLYGHSKVVEDAPLSTYGVQLITVGTVTDNFTLGGNDSSTAINSYNNAISTLNNAANQYNNSLYSTARCVGSDPSNPNSESNYGSYYGHLMKKEDSNYITDVRQMEYLGILNIGQKYWLASRYVYSNSGDCDFALYVAGYTTNTQTSSLFYYREKYGSSQAYVATNAFRPVFTLNSTVKVTGGNGSAGAPYTLGI